MTSVRVELFGLPRVIAGCRQVELALEAPAGLERLVDALARACPPLVDRVIRPDLLALQEGYVFNLNGTAFLAGGLPRLKEGDSLLLLSNQAGG
jgi:hypothetical protein